MGSSRQDIPEELKMRRFPTHKLPLALATVVLITVALMSLYEFSKQLLFPNISIWQSHIITIIFSSLVAALGAYFAFRKINALYLWIVEELARRKHIEQLMLRTERLAAMGHITATLAHEIKNPLQAIYSNLELALEFPLGPEERIEFLQTCHREVKRLIEVTQNVLSLTQVAEKKYSPLLIAPLVNHTLDLLHHPLKKAGIQVSTELNPGMSPIMGEASQIRQVLLNLILNAIEAMPNGGKLHIGAQASQEMLRLTIINSGPPIPSNHIEHIFEPFFTTKREGFGLGLFISHHIVQQHEGMLSAKNLKERQGVAFTITLPLANVPPKPCED